MPDHTRTEFTITIAGEAGQGMQTIGIALCRLFKNAGCRIFANQDYMSRVRGGNNFFQLRISDTPVYTLRRKSDLLIALDKNSVELHKTAVAEGGMIVLDKKGLAITEGNGLFPL